MLVTGCGIFREEMPEIRPSGEGLCEGLQASARNHAGALAEDGGPRSIETGFVLIRGLAAGCGYDQDGD